MKAASTATSAATPWEDMLAGLENTASVVRWQIQEVQQIKTTRNTLRSLESQLEETTNTLVNSPDRMYGMYQGICSRTSHRENQMLSIPGDWMWALLRRYNRARVSCFSCPLLQTHMNVFFTM